MHTLMTARAACALPSGERVLAAAVVHQALADLAPVVDDEGRSLPTTRRQREVVANIEGGGLEYWLDLMELTPGALALVRERIDVAIKGA